MATVNQPSLLRPTNKLTAAMIGLAGAEIVTRWLDANAVILAGPNVDAVIYTAAPFVVAFVAGWWVKDRPNTPPAAQ